MTSAEEDLERREYSEATTALPAQASRGDEIATKLGVVAPPQPSMTGFDPEQDKDLVQ